LLTVLALGWLLTAKPLSSRWWFGWFCALLALGAVGSGVLAATTATAIIAAALIMSFVTRSPIEDSVDKASNVWGLFLIGAIILLGVLLQVKVPQHEPLRAHSLMQFGAVFLRCLSWPWVNSGWLWIVTQAPLLYFLGSCIRRRSPTTAHERLILGLGLLAGLHAAAVAYSRGAGLLDARPLSRYQDPLLLGVAANLMVSLQFIPLHRVGRIAGLLWSGVLLAGLIELTTTNLSLNLPFKRAQDNASLTQIRAYLATHDATIFTRDPAVTGPHPDPAIVRRVLDDPLFRPILPEEFTDVSVPVPRLIDFGPWLALLSGLSLLGVSINWCRRSRP